MTTPNLGAPARELEMVTDASSVTLDVNGETSEVTIYKIPLKHMQDLGRVWTNFPGEAALYARRDEAWASTLSEENLLTVVEGGRRLNFPLFQRWAKLMADSVSALSGNKALENIVTQVARQQQNNAAESRPSPKS